MADPGYVTIPLNSPADEKPAAVGGSSSSAPGPSVAAADRWKFVRSADGKFLSPLAVSRTMYRLMERVAHGSIDTDDEFRLLPFQMESNRSPIVGR